MFQRCYCSFRFKANFLHESKRLLRGQVRYIDEFVKESNNDLSSQQKLLKVAIIGIPNVGKSTLINNLMDRKVCPTSKKVHTTRERSMAIFTEAESQIVFMDTPGLVNWKERQKYKLEKTFLNDSKSSLDQSDVIGVVHDVSNVWTREKLDIKIIKLLESFCHKPSFLIFNKVDLVKSKRKLLDLTRVLTDSCINGQPIPGSTPIKHDSKIRGWPHFQDIFMISALTGDGVEYLRNYLVKQAKPAKWMFSNGVWSDQKAEELIVDTVKAKFLDFLPQEIPYQVKPEMEFFDIKDNGLIRTVVIVNCPSNRINKLIAGTSNGRLRQITQSIENDLRSTFQNSVRLKIVLRDPENP